LAHAARGYDVCLDLLWGGPEQLPADDRLDVLDVEAVQVPSDHLSQLAFRELDDLRIDRGEVAARRKLDQVHPGRLRREGEDFGLVGSLAQDPCDLRDLHLQHSLVGVLGQQRGLLRADARGHVRVVAALDWDPAGDPPEVTSPFGREHRTHWGGHRTSAASLIEYRHPSARIVSNRWARRR